VVPGALEVSVCEKKGKGREGWEEEREGERGRGRRRGKGRKGSEGRREEREQGKKGEIGVITCTSPPRIQAERSN